MPSTKQVKLDATHETRVGLREVIALLARSSAHTSGKIATVRWNVMLTVMWCWRCLPVGVNEAIKMFRVIDSEDPPPLLRPPIESAADDVSMVAFARRDNNIHTGVSNGSHRVSH